MFLDNSIIKQFLGFNHFYLNKRGFFTNLPTLETLSTSFEEALLNSLNNLMYTFRKLYEEALIKKNINFDEKTISGIPIKSYLDYLFNTRCFPNEPALVLKRKFVGAKTPMDLFKINR